MYNIRHLNKLTYSNLFKFYLLNIFLKYFYKGMENMKSLYHYMNILKNFHFDKED